MQDGHGNAIMGCKQTWGLLVIQEAPDRLTVHRDKKGCLLQIQSFQLQAGLQEDASGWPPDTEDLDNCHILGEGGVGGEYHKPVQAAR